MSHHTLLKNSVVDFFNVERVFESLERTKSMEAFYVQAARRHAEWACGAGSALHAGPVISPTARQWRQNVSKTNRGR